MHLRAARMGGLCCIMKPRSVRPSGAFLRLVRGAVMASVHCAAPYRPCRLVPVPGLTLSLSEKLVPVPRPNPMADLTGGIWYTIRHRFARRIRRARNRGNDMSRKREEQAKGGGLSAMVSAMGSIADNDHILLVQARVAGGENGNWQHWNWQHSPTGNI